MSKITMRDCIEMTPDAVRGQIERSDELAGGLAAALAGRAWRRVVLVASGSSYTASMCARPYLARMLACPVEVLFPFTFTHYERAVTGTDDFVLVVSQSGASVNCLDALEAARAAGAAARLLTAVADSDCARMADEVYTWGCGEEAVGYVTFGPLSLATYLMQSAARAADIASGACGAEGAATACVREIEHAIAAHGEVLARADAFVKRAYQQLMQMDRVYVLGCGSNYGTALEGALKIGETVKVLAVAYEQDEFLHGPALQLNPRYTVFVIDGGDETTAHARHVYQGLRKVCPNAFLVKPEALCSRDEHADPNVVALPPSGTEPFSFLYSLPVFQVIASTLSADLDSLSSHPLYYEMNKIIDFRTAKYRTDHPADED